MTSIRFETLGSQHVEWARKLHNDPDVLKMLTDSRRVSRYQQYKWFKNLKRSATSRRWVALADDEPVGIVRLDQIDYQNKSVCIGLDIHKNHRGRGYAKPIYHALFEKWFGEEGFNRIWLLVVSYNRRAINLYTALGFITEGVQEQAIYRDDKFHDAAMMRLLKSEWAK